MGYRPTNEGLEMLEPIDGTEETELVPKPGFEPGHPCGR